MTAKTIGIIAIKGGVGKTTTASNLALLLAREYNKKVLLVDANFSAPNLGFHVGEVNPQNTVHDVLTDKVKIKKAIRKHEAGFDFIPGSLMKSHIYPFKLKSKLLSIKEDYDFIVLDSSPTLNNEILATMMASDSMFCVTTPDFPTLSCTMHAVKMAKDKKTPISGIIINKARNKVFELGLEDIEASTATPVMAVIPDDVNVPKALAETAPCSMIYPNSGASIEYRKLAAAMVGEECKEPNFAKRVIRAITREVPKEEVNRVLMAKGFFEV